MSKTKVSYLEVIKSSTKTHKEPKVVCRILIANKNNKEEILGQVQAGVNTGLYEIRFIESDELLSIMPIAPEALKGYKKPLTMKSFKK